MTEKTGRVLERKVYDTVKDLLERGGLGFAPDSCRVFQGKKYYSRDRQADIVTDVSIEMYLEKSSTPSIIWVWECKDYGKSLPVDEIEEFHSKLVQIGDDRTKGTVITSNGEFQSGAIRYARSKGIGLARLLPEEQIRWVLYDQGNYKAISQFNYPQAEVQAALAKRNFISHDSEFFLLTHEEVMERKHENCDKRRTDEIDGTVIL